MNHLNLSPLSTSWLLVPFVTVNLNLFLVIPDSLQ